MKKLTILRYQDNSKNTMEDLVAEECILHLEINSKLSFDVLFTPEMVKEFVNGNLYTEGFITDPTEIQKYTENRSEDIINVTVKLKDFSELMDYYKKNYNIVWTECGSGAEIKRLADQFKPIENKLRLDPKKILTIPVIIKDKIDHFKQTGAFHYAFLFDSDFNLEALAYDIGRHNAVDKVVGGQLLAGRGFETKVMFTTGRVSSDIILKCLRAKLPAIITRGAPLHTAVKLAKKYNICLIGFLRGKRFNVYSYPEAISNI